MTPICRAFASDPPDKATSPKAFAVSTAGVLATQLADFLL